MVVKRVCQEQRNQFVWSPQLWECMGKYWTKCAAGNLLKEIFEVLSQAGSNGAVRAKCGIHEMSHNHACSQWLSLSASQLGLQHMVQQTAEWCDEWQRLHNALCTHVCCLRQNFTFMLMLLVQLVIRTNYRSQRGDVCTQLLDTQHFKSQLVYFWFNSAKYIVQTD